MKNDILRLATRSARCFFIFSLIIAGCSVNKSPQVCFKDSCFVVEIANSQQERARGLMYRESLDKNSGMLFIFSEEATNSFWMKNTLIPLDIIWINKDKEVVHIKKNALPCKEDDCLSIRPNKEALYVLEVNSGVCERIGLEVGDKALFNLN